MTIANTTMKITPASHRIALGASSLRVLPDGDRPRRDEAELPATQVAVEEHRDRNPKKRLMVGMNSSWREPRRSFFLDFSSSFVPYPFQAKARR
jgi:hypothetical protein